MTTIKKVEMRYSQCTPSVSSRPVLDFGAVHLSRRLICIGRPASAVDRGFHDNAAHTGRVPACVSPIVCENGVI